MEFKLVPAYQLFRLGKRMSALKGLGFSFHKVEKSKFWIIEGVPSISIENMEELMCFLKEHLAIATIVDGVSGIILYS